MDRTGSANNGANGGAGGGMEDGADDPQATLWNGVKGRAWVEAQDLVDRMLAPLEARLVDMVGAGYRGHVLDVGCGTGGTTLAVARALGPGGRCTGVDISEAMIEAARARAERDGTPSRFVRADAQTHAFEPAGVDRVVSRFGVMFFDDFVEAFANLRRAARDGAALRFLSWRGAGHNPFMTTAERAAAPIVPDLPPRRPDAPGQFGLADRDRIHRILTDSGWTEIDIRPVDAACTLPEADLVRFLTRFGPLGQVFDRLDEGTRRRVVETVRPAFDPFVAGAEARFTAACWAVAARAPGASAAPEAAPDV